MIYDSIRPGRKSGDPVVTDLRWLQYDPTGKIKYALDFFQNFSFFQTDQRKTLYQEI